ncbi:MAG: imidazolonepropionase [Candidatus Marinimicrobia bacterium]|jgi:imidazolonepropionase|nr:imidazolonepropionase [Candidatus Neomarinimicrobiota bacterium]MBT3632074.1 imidazolonepropionase [Candidatus Neomarinimicrobiota bacterium]MBT3824660.1 imidazolonepropionase [Candidatus Neomarinimicrobiota bacterium]MBT4130166.1 imidazolonepropionase [Candidatus Neomarinimicrobiota bacterium]MBT4296916.1 imidazolonepropionase [Candidatus Neomarinimicrobiota bacterium]
MSNKTVKGITNIGQWVTWNPVQSTMEVGEGGTWLIENGQFSDYSPKSFSDPEFLDGQGQLLTPGLIDSHTHPAFAATRELEFEMRSQGKTYQEIAEAGGGIRNSVRKLREISESELANLVETRLSLMLRHGTTTAECKSGYGLSTEAEIKSLRAIRTASKKTHLQTFSTLLGAHEIPDEYRNERDTYIDLVINDMIPAVAEQNLAQYCDVFCEEGVYTAEETEKILLAARDHGMQLKFHADEFVSSGGAELAAKLGALSADHLMAISDAGISALAGSDTVATLLPGTTFFLGSNTWAPARKLLDAGVTVALATDFNPGSNMSLSMPFVMTLAVIYLHLTPLEALQAATLGAAKSMGIEKTTGSISPGYRADAVLWQSKNYKQLPYFYGSNQVYQIMVGGKPVL